MSTTVFDVLFDISSSVTLSDPMLGYPKVSAIEVYVHPWTDAELAAPTTVPPLLTSSTPAVINTALSPLILVKSMAPITGTLVVGARLSLPYKAKYTIYTVAVQPTLAGATTRWSWGKLDATTNYNSKEGVITVTMTNAATTTATSVVSNALDNSFIRLARAVSGVNTFVDTCANLPIGGSVATSTANSLGTCSSQCTPAIGCTMFEFNATLATNNCKIYTDAGLNKISLMSSPATNTNNTQCWTGKNMYYATKGDPATTPSDPVTNTPYASSCARLKDSTAKSYQLVNKGCAAGWQPTGWTPADFPGCVALCAPNAAPNGVSKAQYAWTKANCDCDVKLANHELCVGTECTTACLAGTSTIRSDNSTRCGPAFVSGAGCGTDIMCGKFCAKNGYVGAWGLGSSLTNNCGARGRGEFSIRYTWNSDGVVTDTFYLGDDDRGAWCYNGQEQDAQRHMKCKTWFNTPPAYGPGYSATLQ